MIQTTADLCDRAIVAGERWKERAIKAEALNAELLAALKDALDDVPGWVSTARAAIAKAERR